MTREEFNKNSYLVNNNALYNKHTEHISTTEPIFIDGMAGSDNIVHERGGDASQNTYWAYEYESGKFLLGKFNEDDIKVKCETDSSDLWIVDAEGVYIEQDALNSYMESDCLDAINAKYGTNFSTLTMQKVKSIDIGDTLPNWNAYEKIEIQEIPIKVLVSLGNGFTFGSIFVESGRYDLESKQNEDNKVYTLDSNGVVTRLNDYSDSFGNYILSRINTVYPTINSVNQVFNENLEIGEQINISEYIKI